VVPPRDRRILLAELLAEGEVEPPRPDTADAALTYPVLLPRVRAVYAQAARPWPEDTEALVHDVRVATRRLAAALALLRPLLGGGAARRGRRRAKALRNALGVSREADVMVADFRRLAEATALDDAAVHALDALIERGQAALQKTSAAYPPERLLRHGLDLLSTAAAPPHRGDLRGLAAPHLYAAVTAAEALLEPLQHPHRPEEHHQLRIECKHVRYAVELLAPAFPELLDGPALADAMKGVQDALGVLNDAQDLREWLQASLLDEAVGAAAAAEIRTRAEAERQARYEAARDLVLADAPRLFGELRRAAGLMGQLTTAA
jgi:CHAD domain-containing protein